MRRVLPAALALLALAAHGGALDCGFVYDDHQYLTMNPAVERGLDAAGVEWAFTTFHAGNWHPLTWLSHMLDVSLHGMEPRGHHLTNLLLHAAATVLVYLLVAWTTDRRWSAALVAAVHAVHPLHVESVAWVAERKDLLSACLGLAALLAHARHARRPGPGRYAVVCLLLALGLAAKPMLVTLPLVMLLLDLWPLGRREPPWRLALEKLPLLALSAASSVVTLAAQRGAGALQGLELLPLAQRLANAPVAVARYLMKAAWPADLAVFYPHPRAGLGTAVAVLCALALAGATAAVLATWRRRPWLAVGWLWFLGMLFPVLGLVQVGEQALADRYTYLPLVGLSWAAVWGAAALATRLRLSRAATVLASALVVTALAAGTRGQVAHWRDEEALYRRALAVEPANPLALTALGTVVHRRGRPAEAEALYREALRLTPGLAKAHYNLGLALEDLGREEEAMACYAEALRAQVDHAPSHHALAGALGRRGRVEEALGHYREAVRLRPLYAPSWLGLGVGLERTGRGPEALAAYREAFRLDPTLADARSNLARLLRAAGREAEAEEVLHGGR